MTQGARGFSSTMAHRVSDAWEPDLFPTPPWGARAGAELIRQLDPEAEDVWECACGAGHMAHGLADYFQVVYATDKHPWRVRPREGATGWRAGELYDFLGGSDLQITADWIVTNPPFGPAEAFVQAALLRARRGVAMLLRLGFLESAGREQLLYGARRCTVVAPFIERLPMHKNRYLPAGSTAGAYAWFIWLQPWVRRPVWVSAWGPQLVPVMSGSKKRLFQESDHAFAGWVEPIPEGEP